MSMMELGYAGYDTENFRVILEYFATIRNFKAIVIVDKQRRLVAYIPAGQAASLVGATLPDFRKQFVEAVSTGSMAPSWDPELMTDASVKLGASYADALAAMDNRSLPCIAVVDDKGRFLGIMERDHIANSLLLALARAAGSRPTHSSAAGAL